MPQEELFKDLCARLPYGVKILHTGWDSDRDTDFNTVETLIGIDNRFIYTIWDKTGDREKHCLFVSNWKPYLRPMSSMTEEERIELRKLCEEDLSEFVGFIKNGHGLSRDGLYMFDKLRQLDWLNSHHFDYRGLIPMGLALEALEGMYKNK